MTVVGLTADGKKIVREIVTGPSSYSSGGWTETIDELNMIQAVSISIKTHLKTSNLVTVVDYSISGNTITFTAYQIDVTATSASWSEPSDGTDLSSLVIEVIAIGY